MYQIKLVTISKNNRNQASKKTTSKVNIRDQSNNYKQLYPWSHYSPWDLMQGFWLLDSLDNLYLEDLCWRFLANKDPAKCSSKLTIIFNPNRCIKLCIKEDT